jgi:hypothetical protein
MAAEDLSAAIPGSAGIYTKRIALEATATNAREIICPEWARRADLVFKQSDGTTDDTGALASSGTDGAAIGNDKIPIASGATYTFRLSAGRSPAGGSIFVAGGTASAFVHIALQPE